MAPLAASTFVEVLLASFIIIPVTILWIAAIVDIIRRVGSGWGMALWTLLILALPIVGPLVYFGVRQPPDAEPGVAHAAEMERRREAAQRPAGGTGVYR